MSDTETTTAAPATKPKPAKKNFYKDKADKLAAENARLQAELATKNAVAEHFKAPDTIEVVDEHDRAKLKHQEQIADAKERGVDMEEIIEESLDSSEVRALGYKGKEWLKAHRLRWVNRVSRNSSRVNYHKGKGFFMVRPSEHPVRPTHGIKDENTWILGDTVLMAEPMDFFIRSRARADAKMQHQGADMREGTREQINKLIRDETGQPHAQPGLTKSYKDNTWDRVEEGSQFDGPSGQAIPPATP